MKEIYNRAVDKWGCLNAGGLWRNKFMNFDSTPNAMSTLFIISNSVSWKDTMYHAMQARGLD